ncbi:MAG: threonine/serine dehydratase [Thermus sp.]|uniref:threonine/serine dehydratase n=1 Tax=unclassified Thermus TaxID=2619321 RepID=UPI00059E2CC0|nr:MULTISPECIES: threonine/serine dehydratase [unclassified Thermus]MCS6869091.1 threonine/serine dehydratase [Thermus sp.]MCS7217815.1 threonine/serine dehydratase [Thermus sp.]MDW8016633.1 threonine/serine dehydratase [Thermus sp.]MDW8356532.1 threonine/serine dehydratase [Thermus sp.]
MDLAEIYAALRRIAPYTHRTPLLTSHLLDELLGKRLLLKAEHLQKTGSFKARGALSKALTLEDPKGLLAVSSGNHAQGVAYAARVLGVKALIVMPEDASPLKKAAARAYGAEVYDQGVTVANREAVARALQEETGYAFLHPFDDPLVVAGQGTLGLELLAQASRQGSFPEAVLVPVGGGGLAAGVATAVKALAPTTLVLGVEPEGADDARRSLEAGRILRLAEAPRTRADGVRTLSLGAYTFPILKAKVDGILPVSEEAILEAERLLHTRTKQVVEPTGALPLAAVLEHGARLPQTLALVLSGGNRDFSP